jgi:glutamine synthetase
MLSKEILHQVTQHPAGKVKLALTDIDGILRGKYISTEKFLSIAESTCGFCDVIFGWDAADAAYDNSAYTGWHTGYPDAPVRLDLNTLRSIPWENDAPFFLAEMADHNHTVPYVCPRRLLKKVIDDMEADGFSACFSQEFEWFNFFETPQSARDRKYDGLIPISPGMFGYSILRATLNQSYISDLFDSLKKFNVPIEGLHTETGPGVYEAAIEYSDVLEAADRAVLFKTSVKEIAYRHSILATFMAKISETLPGCGGHVHQSLWDRAKKKNLFYDGTNQLGMSDLMQSYLAGQLFCIPFLLPLYAPNVNSYKRLVEGAWAPTTLTWGADNRTVAIRAISNGSKSCRIETRVPGADVNPYLAMAAALASGLYGIRRKMKLDQPPTTGNGYKDFSHGTLPSTLIEATRNMKNSDIANEILGEQFVDHFAGTREWEWRQHLKAVTDWEKNRYMEII